MIQVCWVMNLSRRALRLAGMTISLARRALIQAGVVLLLADRALRLFRMTHTALWPSQCAILTSLNAIPATLWASLKVI